MTDRTSTPRVPLGTLVEHFGGEFGGDPAHEVTGFATLESARSDQLAFVTGARYRAAAPASAAGAILVTPTDAAALADDAGRLWVCRDPYLQFARIAQHFERLAGDGMRPGIASTAHVDPSAVVDPSATIGAFAVVGRDAVVAAEVRVGAHVAIGDRVRVGAGTVIHPHVVVYAGCTIGKRCIVHGGAVVGADGFGFAKDGPRWIKIPQVGGVRIGDDVEIGANTTIDRGALDDTVIGDGVKLDNQIQIGHNVRIGDDTIMAAFVGIAGSAVVGRRCQIGGAARIMGHVTIVDDVVVSTQTFVSRSIAKAGQYTGYYPMAEHAAFEKSAAVLRRLDGLRDRVKRLESAGRDASAHDAGHPSEPERPA